MTTPNDEVVIKSADMPQEMQDQAVAIAKKGLSMYTVESAIAAHVKREFEDEHGLCWHCVVGKNFGANVGHHKGNFLYFYIGDTAVLLFKTG